ncbi:MAG: hypothetical protein KJI71_01570 [Patescibacteria group bacterium]|nr:hypothetical protein [Patescibacteria group bacterium]
MSDKMFMKDVLDAETVQLLLKLMKLRRERKEKDGLSMNMVLRFIVQREIQIIKDDYPTGKDLKERNLNRFKKLQGQKQNPVVYCPQFHMEIQNIMMCHVSCPFGHMLECHYPYEHNSDFCEHYKAQRELENQIEINYLDPGDPPVI